ncbi:peptidoglycan-associated lipoprotein Pal [Oceanicella actignis]|uniref:Peptidoglycan-associated lipoprotein n=1 Tax=Oceanicella actignis TaxID=1189325 RepID=A0A1M7TVY4_9RHOB|nr:peptidoglycan-associated lipoprotein Pal [Oceanicella actignis]SES80760.1 peptidoglycan-associated lipoprotein [Oceanicella actignis]SHN74813.1 peptidoglycan-associated lipoprotein [Oceanicella actignis]
MTRFNLVSRLILAATLSAALAACSSDEAARGGADAAAGAGAGAGGATAAGQLDPGSIEYFRTAVGDTVWFDTDSAALSAEAQETLRRQADWLLRNPGINAVIEGHADERGTRDYNLALGARRATAARNFLIGEGVAPERLTTVSYGKERPVALCSDESCWRQNRRAVTVAAGAPLS